MTGTTNTGTNPGFIEEKVTSVYGEINGRVKVDNGGANSLLRYNAGLRFVSTEQIFGSLASVADPRNTPAAPALALADGGRYPATIVETLTSTTYTNLLPSASVAFNVLPDVVLRASASKTMTRPNPQDLRATSLQFSDPAAGQATLTNAELKAYVSKNFDMGAEWYTGREGYLSAAFFKKDITAFTAAQNTVVPFTAYAARAR